MEQIIADQKNNYTILLSESCYPITSNKVLNSYLSENSGCEHIDILPVEDVWDSWQNRINKYKINFSANRCDYALYSYFFEDTLANNLKNIQHILALTLKRRNINLLTNYLQTFRKRKATITSHYGGSAWWAFTFATLKKVFEFVNANQAFVRFHKNTLLPDEIFFQTIVQHLASVNGYIKIKSSLTYVNWSAKDNPVALNENVLDEIATQRKQNKFFARKFIPGFSDNLLNILDQNALPQEYVVQ